MAKERTLNELRQNKEYGYKPPRPKKKRKKKQPKDAYWAYKDTKVKRARGVEINGHKIPDPKLHQQVSFIKSGIRILGYAALWWSIDIAATLLILSEVVGIGEELV